MGHLPSSYWPGMYPQSTRDCLLTRTQSPKTSQHTATPKYASSVLTVASQPWGRLSAWRWWREPSLCSKNLALSMAQRTDGLCELAAPPLPYFKTGGNDLMSVRSLARVKRESTCEAPP